MPIRVSISTAVAVPNASQCIHIARGKLYAARCVDLRKINVKL